MAYKSPFNYIGNKYRIIDEVTRYFPKEINTFVDLFCGGCDVTINTKANRKIANDINSFVIDIFRWLQSHTVSEALAHIKSRIEQYGLSKQNRDGYLAFRSFYNSNPEAVRHPMDLYTLVCYSFNYQFRFNNNHEFNNPFGKDRSCFSRNMESNLVLFHDLIKNTTFLSKDFVKMDYNLLQEGDFVYADPPYYITCGSYNDGKRGFNGWRLYDEILLTQTLDKLNERGVAFAMSNVIEHKGKRNAFLHNWATDNGYFIHDINFNYDNCNYQARNKENITREVLITNY